MKQLLFILFALPMVCFAQLSTKQGKQIDSLKLVIESAKHDSIIINAWIKWDDIIFVSDPNLDFELNLKIDSLCLFNLSKRLSEKEKTKFQKSRAFSLNNIGLIYSDKGDYKLANDYFNECIKINKTIGNRKGIANAFTNIGLIKKLQGDYGKAIDYYIKSLKISEEIGDEMGVSGAFNNIGVLYREQGDYANAIIYYSKCLKISEKIGNKLRIAGSLNNIGKIHYYKGEHNEAIDFYLKSLKISKEMGNKNGVAATLNNIGNVHKDKKNFVKAIESYGQSLKMREEIGDKKGISGSLNSIGSIHYHEGNHSKAIDYSSKALKIAQEIGAAVEAMEAANTLWLGYKQAGLFKEALGYYELYVQSKDSLESETNQKELIRQEYKYKYEKRAAADSVRIGEETKLRDALLNAEKAENKQQKQRAYFLYGGLVLAVLFGGFVFNRYRITTKQKGMIQHQKMRVDLAFNQLEKKNKEIMSSIKYAKRIQSAILPPNKVVKEYLKESFILYKPKDIVAGDFYWLEHRDGKVLFAVADCTGHGVPGAMVSVVCNNGLNRSVREHGLTDPGAILAKTRAIVIDEFEKSEDEVNDGMDIALCSLEGNILTYAGANNPLWIIRKGSNTIEETKANKQPIGKFDNPLPYSTHTFKLNMGDCVYIFSDGYVDQFGGEKGKKFKARALRELLLSVKDLPMEEQNAVIDKTFEAWKGNEEQIDDVCMIGVKI